MSTDVVTRFSKGVPSAYTLERESEMVNGIKEKLKPCPFCGSEVEDVTVKIANGTIEELKLYCRRCSAEFTIRASDLREWGTGKPLSSAIDTWNRRSNDETTDGL